MDAFAMKLGYTVMACTGTAVALLLVIGAAMLFNRATWKVLDAYGGIKTFNEYRRWYGEQPENQVPR